MAGEPQFYNDGVLTVETDDATSTPIAGLKQTTITPGWETNELYTADSGLREVVKQYEHSVQVEIEYVTLDVETAQEWLGGDGTTGTSTTDTSDPQLFSVEFVTPGAKTGSPEYTASVTDVFFPEFPIVDGSEGEFMTFSLSGTGRTVDNFDDTSGA